MNTFVLFWLLPSLLVALWLFNLIRRAGQQLENLDARERRLTVVAIVFWPIGLCSLIVTDLWPALIKERHFKTKFCR